MLHQPAPSVTANLGDRPLGAGTSARRASQRFGEHDQHTTARNPDKPRDLYAATRRFDPGIFHARKYHPTENRSTTMHAFVVKIRQTRCVQSAVRGNPRGGSTPPGRTQPGRLVPVISRPHLARWTQAEPTRNQATRALHAARRDLEARKGGEDPPPLRGGDVGSTPARANLGMKLIRLSAGFAIQR